MNGENRFGALSRPEICEEEADVKSNEFIFASQLSVDAPEFVPRAVQLNSSAKSDEKLEQNNCENSMNNLNKDGWTVVKPKVQQKSQISRPKRSFDEEKLPVRSSRQKALEGILARRRVLILMRGPSGSGKSYLAKNLKSQNGVVLSTDEYFLNDNNVYEFKPDRLQDAHSWNFQRAVRAMENRVTPVIIDNTNCQAWEMKPYVQSGIRNNYEIHFLIPDTPWRFDAKECARLNKHGVSYDQILNMIERFDRNITLRTFTQPNYFKSTRPSSQPFSSAAETSFENRRNETKPISSPAAFDVDDSAAFQTKNDATNFLNDLNAWDNDRVEISSSWGVADEKPTTPTIYFNAKSSSSSSSSNDSLTPKKQRTPNNKTSSSLFNSASFMSADSWLLPEHSLTTFADAEINDLGTKTPPPPTTTDEEKIILTCDKQCYANDKIILLANVLRRRTSAADDADIGGGDYSRNARKIHRRFSVTFDKGVQTDVVRNEETWEDGRTADEIFKSFFPDVPDEDLKHILSNCDGDVQWATNVLLDSGYEINYSIINSENDAQTPGDFDGALNENEVADDEIEIVDECPPSTSASGGSDENSAYLMELSVDMASQLQHLFGRLHDDLPAEYLSPQQLKIRLPLDLVQQLFLYWLETQNRRNNNDDFFVDENESDELDAFDEFLTSDDAGSAMSSVNIREQMFLDEQLARQILDEEYLNHPAEPTADPSSLSTKLKLKKLIDMFPGVDDVVLKELFKANKYLLEPTIEVICQSFNIPPNRKLQPTASFVSVSTSSAATKRSQRETSVPPDQAPNLNYDQLRQEAVEHYHQRKEYFAKAQQAYRRGMRSVASYYAQIGRVHDTKFKETNRMAAQTLLEFRKCHDPPDSLDLHGLHVSEAVAALAEKLKDYDGRTGKILKIITGKGKHSEKGPKIKPAVVAFLVQRKYAFSDAGAGLIEIHIK